MKEHFLNVMLPSHNPEEISKLLGSKINLPVIDLLGSKVNLPVIDLLGSKINLLVSDLYLAVKHCELSSHLMTHMAFTQ